MDVTDNELVKQYRVGDERALEMLIRRHLRSVFRFTLSYAHNTAWAEDITQETFVKAWRNLAKFDDAQNFRAWLFTIAKHTALDYLKKKSPVPFSDFDDAEGNNVLAETLRDESLLPDAVGVQRELRVALDDAASALPADHCEVLRLRYREGYSFAEIAALVKKPVNTVRSWHRRAIVAIREIVKF